MTFAVTGAAGFLGWHARCALRARGVPEVISIDRPGWTDPDLLSAALRGADVVLHLAGANRAGTAELRAGNLRLAQELTAALDREGQRPVVVYANSLQSGNGTPFGDGKHAAAEHLADWGRRAGSAVIDVRLPNLFGEHGRPNYNSVVASFCHELSTGGRPAVIQDREIPLLHVQDAVAQMLDLAAGGRAAAVSPAGRPMRVSALLALLTHFRDLYASGDIPDITDPLHLALFNTYRSFTFPHHFPVYPTPHDDHRGHLFECVRSHGGQGQVFCSTSHPGLTRGNHFHLRKVERFQVLHGSAEIALRRLFDDRVVRFRVSGERPAIVDMPTMWAHAITNVGDTELTTLFWAHELLDPRRPDTYPEPVGAELVGARHG